MLSKFLFRIYNFYTFCFLNITIYPMSDLNSSLFEVKRNGKLYISLILSLAENNCTWNIHRRYWITFVRYPCMKLHYNLLNWHVFRGNTRIWLGEMNLLAVHYLFILCCFSKTYQYEFKRLYNDYNQLCLCILKLSIEILCLVTNISKFVTIRKQKYCRL